MREITDQIKAEAERMRNAGKSYEEIARAFGVSASTLMYRIDPIYAAKVRQRREAKRRAESEELKEIHRNIRAVVDMRVQPRPDESIVARQRAYLRDPDTRDLTGRLLGDPHPSRQDFMRHYAA